MNKDLQEVLNKYGSFNSLPIEKITPEVARQQPELRDAVLGVLNDHAAKRLIGGLVEPVASIEHVLIESEGGLELLARIYRPSGSDIKPATLYFHGGGMVIASLNTYDASCRALANAADCTVISVAYRQAPEHKYPAAKDDAFSAYQWLRKNAAALRIDPCDIAVTGESAGGNLATGVCLSAKQKGVRQPVHQVLIYPMLDAKFDTASYIENANAKPLNREMMKWFWNHYLTFDTERQDPLACPLRADDLTGLAPATVITAEIDPLSSEGEAYAKKLMTFGVPVQFRQFKDVSHEFFGMAALVSEAKEAVRFVADQLQGAFSGVDASTETILTRAKSWSESRQ